jgi:hypothetical protein
MVAAKLYTRDFSKSMRGPVKEFLKIDPSPLLRLLFAYPFRSLLLKAWRDFKEYDL